MSKHLSWLARSRSARAVLVTAVALAVTGGTASVAVAARVPAAQAARSAAGSVRRACAVTHQPGQAYCMALVRTDVRQRPSLPGAPPVGFGYGPADLHAAYNLPAGGPEGEKVAVVDAFNNPNAVADFNFYRAAWGLAPCNPGTGAGCLTVLNQNGAAAPLPPNAPPGSWALEESLDVDMVAAICADCHVYLMEAKTAMIADLGTAVNSAVNVVKALFVSNSYGAPESNQNAVFDAKYYKHPGVVITASSGDSGYAGGVAYPAASQFDVAIGGTTLTKGGGARGWTETVWRGTGSGCSAFEFKPVWQRDPACRKRIDNDVAFVADPNTGVAVRDTFDPGGPWFQLGGTSVGAPSIASVFALAGPIPAGKYGAQLPYAAAPAGLFDIVLGNNGVCVPPPANAYFCTAGVGYDGPTGWGTPNGINAF